MSLRRSQASSKPIQAQFAAGDITFGAGVAIYHLASEQVVVCWHSRDKYWFLPKGRRNASEDAGRAAEREGFEESGYRNRLLPLPIPHVQPYPDDAPEPLNPFDTEPLWTQLAPQSRTHQYVLLWYAAETVPESDDFALSALSDGHQNPPLIEGEPQLAKPYHPPPPFPEDLTLRERIQQDLGREENGERRFYVPKKHEGTGVNEEEMLYQSRLMPIEDAVKCLGSGVQADVVRKGWEAVRLRMQIEEKTTC